MWHRPPSVPRWPPDIDFHFELERDRTKEEKETEEVLHLFTCYMHSHNVHDTQLAHTQLTHTQIARWGHTRGGWRGRRGTWRHPPSFYVAGVVFGNIDFYVLRGRRGTYGTGLALVTRLDLGVAPGTSRLLAWQAWHLEISTLISCGRRGTW